MILIFCPRSNATGGTELLHQLGYKLNLLEYDARIYYYGDDCGLPATHPHFLKYGVPVVESVSDSRDNILIFPEMMVSSLEGIKGQLPLSKCVLWWLSVDNAGMTPDLVEEISDDTTLIHFVQSYYAFEYVKQFLNVSDDRLYWLSDYLNYNFLNMENRTERDDVVLFNPRKGFDRTAGLIQSSDHRVKWKALAGLMPEHIPDELQRAKVYIDFGGHPGKDRFPREAVSCGCRIITGTKGAAANDHDIPIPRQLKVDDNLDNDSILGLIYSLLENYDKTGELYADYNNKIHEEFHLFEADTLNVFTKITGKVPDGSDFGKERLRAVILEAVTNEDYEKAFYYGTVYRIKEYGIDNDFIILEGYTRLGLGEPEVALYLMNKYLINYEQDYEAYLIKARAMISLGLDGVGIVLDTAVRLSAGTEDEKYVSEAVQLLKG